MKVKFFFVVSFLLISIALSGMQTSVSNHKGEVSFRGTGGPDDYGYEWIDSDEAGGPTYNWIDITGIGVPVHDFMSDDDNTGPYPMGFDFPYYWYLVNEFYVNSNGAISFSDGDVYVPQGSSGFFIPSTNHPNDLLIPLGADISFEGDSGECYYYTNNVDTFIISYIDVPAWTFGGLIGAHTFQLILTRQDSCIYFQYGKQVGDFYLDSDCAGIENVIGNVGLQVFYYTMPDSGYAVKFIPPESTSYEALDIGISQVLNPGSKGVFIYPNEPYTISTKIRNYGNMDAGSFLVSCLLWDTTYTSYFTDTITVSGLVAGAETTLYFTPDWTPPAVNDYLAFIQTILSGDINPTNNSKDVEIEVITIPGWMTYDSDPTSASITWWLGAGGGWGQEFEPPQYPIKIDSVMVTIASPNGVNCPVLFMDDDGPNGSPGTILYVDTIWIPASGFFDYYTISIPSPACSIYSGKFYVGWIQLGDTFPRNTLEQNGPFSRRCWEFTGSWAPYRERDGAEFLIRTYTSSIQGVSEGIIGTKTYSLSLLPVNPNPVKENARIYYALPNEADVSLKVYNLLGQEVRTLVNEKQKTGSHWVTFDTKNSKGNPLPQGVYFYRLTVGDRSLTRKITLLR
ncbi:MAG: T9SS type A sorting domain-containing protein [Candidatus Cloacimonadota bacterium]|nr:MAG: T9SS type A sorting domain-containing protein [Candidatus Cloacimonadota bacterium]